jgi:hypothetical protein
MAVFLIVSGAPAAQTKLNEQTVYSAAAVTMGANGKVGGDLNGRNAGTIGAMQRLV